MIRCIKPDTFLAKHWLGIRYHLHIGSDVVESEELISQYLFTKDLLDLGISFYDIDEKGHAYYDIKHNKLNYSPNLKQLLHIMKTKESLTDVCEQAAKMLSLILLGICIFTHLWTAVLGWFFLIYMFRQFKYIDILTMLCFGSTIIIKTPILLPVLIANLLYISKVKGDYFYDILVCHSRRYRG